MTDGPSTAADRVAGWRLTLLAAIAATVVLLAVGALLTLASLYRSEILDHCSRLRDWWRGHPEAVLGLLPFGLVAYVAGTILWRAIQQQAAATRLLAALDRPRPLPARLDRLAHALGIVPDLDYVDHPVPVCFCHGLRRPRICVSAGLVALLDDLELAAVLRHERHHLARRDPARLLAARALCAGIGFVPGVAGIYDSFAAATEIAADTAASTDEAGHLALAQAVLKLLRAQHGLRDLSDAPVSAIAPRATRVDALLGCAARPPRLPRRALAEACVGVGLTACLVVAPVALAARPEARALHPCAIEHPGQAGGMSSFPSRAP